MATKITALIYLVNVIFIIILIFFDKKQPSSVLLWSLILLLIPVAGLILYIFLGKGPSFGSKKKFLNKFRQDRKFEELKKGQLELIEESGLSEDIKKMAKFNFENGSFFSGRNEIQLFSDVNKLYEDMLYEIENAKNYIYAEYYRIRDDEWGRKIVNLLAKMAAEGFCVKVLYDDLGCWGLRKDFFDSIIKCGGEVRAFFPSRIKFINRNLNYRNHRKFLIIDGVCAYTGGSNIGDEYTGKEKKTSPWTDCNIKLRGDSAALLNIRFLQDCSFASKQGVKFTMEKHGITNRLPVQMLFDGPDTEEGSIEQAYIKAIYGAKKRVYLQTPYLIPDEAFKLALVSVAKSGVDVRIMIPSKADKKYVYYATLAYAAELVKGGVKVFAREGFLHSKTLIIDDTISAVGSFNIDIRSFFLQFEAAAFIYDKEFTEKLDGIFSEDLKHSTELDALYFALRPLRKKMLARTMRLLTPIM